MFRRILVANRGEIACRVMRTARRMGVATVAVFSDPDAGALHVAMADAAVALGGSAARESYLDGARIIAAARRMGAEAIHPGYGFLSENADFAEACAAAGLVFIGPPTAAIRAMGSKAEAKALMAAAGVPLVPGYHGEAQEAALLAQEAARIGYPVLIKASAGGGGRGMRVVTRTEEFSEALASAAREAQAAFGDARVLLEKYLDAPRHIEVQVFGDATGRVVSLHERDCSVQRRHQKVVEEAPAPGMSAALRARMSEAACAAARAVGYQGAGTVEFIIPGGGALDAGTPFYFMEMNTRLQVEHPVTEMITGLDLVGWQLRVAAGEALPATLPAIHGHAIEVRLCAEDPARDFLPATGRILHLAEPAPIAGALRIESGIRAGDVVTPFYDSMLAKLVVWGEDRAAALHRLRTALDAYAVIGPASNLHLLRQVAASPAFAAGGVDTGFLARHPELAAAPATGSTGEAARLAAALFVLAEIRVAARMGDAWSAADGWRLGSPAAHEVVLGEDGSRVIIPLLAQGQGALWEGQAVRLEAGRLWRDDVAQPVTVVAEAERIIVLLEGREHRFERLDPLAAPAAVASAGGGVVAPIPGRVIRLDVALGDMVAAGDALVVIEAMKMEIVLRAPAAGRIAALHAALGGMVAEGVELVVLAPLAP